MSESNDPWDSITSRPPQPAAPPPTPAPGNPRKDPGLAPLYDPPDWRGDLIRQLALVGLIVSIVSAVGLLCCPLLPLVGLAISAPAIFMAQKDLKQFSDVHPDFLEHLTNSRSMAIAGTIVSGIASAIGLLGTLIYVFLFLLGIAADAGR